jgi:hypothetical protein
MPEPGMTAIWYGDSPVFEKRESCNKNGLTCKKRNGAVKQFYRLAL